MASTAYQELRLVFAGTPDFAAAHLQALLDAKANLIAVYTQPDRPAGRGKKLTPSPVKTLAVAHNLPVCQPQSLRDPAAQAEFAALHADLFVVVAYGLLIPEVVLNTPKHGCINVHASLLPRWRGAAPIQRAIEAGDRETGITIMQMDVGLDTGAMLHKTPLAIAPNETGGSLHDRLAQLGPPALLATLNAIAEGRAKGEQQDDSQSCYARKISKPEAEIDWQQAADAIERKVRAFNPFPVAFTLLNGEPLRLWSAIARNQSSRQAPGTIIAAGDKGLEIACGDGALLVTSAQLAGKKAMTVADILRGNPQLFAPGTLLGGRPL
jgi:methionyl-tRNA formyltransferase